MKRTLLSTLAVALLLGTSTRASANDDLKPIVVASLANYETLIRNIDIIGDASGSPDLGQALEAVIQLMTQGQGLASLDKSRPWGGLVMSDGVQTFQILGFLPVTNVEKFLGVLEGFAQPENLGDGLWRVDMSGLPIPMLGDAMYFKQHGDWTYVSMGAEFLQDLPEDPQALLGGLDTRYDMAGQLNFGNIPEILRQLLAEQLKIAVEQRFEGGMPLPGMDQLPQVEVPEQMDLALRASEAQIESMIDMINETESLTFGVKIDQATKHTTMDLEIKAIPDTTTALELGTLAGSTTRFAGFYQADAPVSTNIAMVLSADDIENAVTTVHTLRDEVFSMMDGADLLSDEYIRSTLKDFVGDIFAIMESSVRTGRVDTGISLLGDGPHTLIYGAHVADGKEVTKLIDKFVDTLETEVGFYGFERNVAKVEDITFHRVIAPIPGGPEADAFADLFGDQLYLVLAVGPTSAYIALGEDALDLLKDAVTKSHDAADEKVSPVQFTAKLAKLLELAAIAGQDGGGDPNLDVVKQSLQDGDDRINVTVKAIENGASFSLVGEPALLKVIGTMAMTLGPALGAPQF